MGMCSGRSMALVEITPAPAANPSKLAAQARRYCRRQGGEVQTRVATFGTNNPELELPLNGTRQCCKFTSPTDGTHVFIGLDALAARQPTLVALAYLTRPQVEDIVRGVDLTSSLAYQSANPPFVFGN